MFVKREMWIGFIAGLAQLCGKELLTAQDAEASPSAPRKAKARRAESPKPEA